MTRKNHVDGGRFSRMARMATMAARTTAELVAAKAVQRVTGGDELDLGTALMPTAERMVQVLGEMKGAATKIGQFVSLVDQDIFPQEAKRALHKLLNQAPQRMAWSQVEAVLLAELQRPLSQLFADIDPSPLAAASLGQVHRATLPDGRAVVVKVQFPGVDTAIESDLRNAAMMAKALSLAGGVFDNKHYYKELAAVLRRELDYRQEIEQAELYRAAMAPWPDLLVPQYFADLSSERVLTIEFLDGPTMLEVAQDANSSADLRFRIGAQLVAATWGPFLRHRVIHADPHPGNYVVLPDGRLGVLDFGATKQFSLPFVHAYWRLLDAAFSRKKADLFTILVDAGFDMQGDRVRAEAWLRDLSSVVERPFARDHYDWGGCRIVADVIAMKSNYGLTPLRVRAPEESLMFYRSAAGAAGDLRMLRSAGNFRQVLMDVADRARGDLAPELQTAVGAGPHQVGGWGQWQA